MYPMYPGMYLSCIDSSEEWTLELLMCPLLARVDIVWANITGPIIRHVVHVAVPSLEVPLASVTASMT